MARVTATGLYKGKQITVSCVEENGDILVYKNGMEDEHIKTLLDMHANWREIECEGLHVYSPVSGTIEAYWVALYEGLFDKPPKTVEIEGEIDTAGSPYTDEDDSDVVY